MSRPAYDKAVDLMFDFEGRIPSGNEAGSIPITPSRNTIFRNRSQAPEPSAAASAPTGAAVHTSLLHSSGVFNLDSSTDGNTPFGCFIVRSTYFIVRFASKNC